MMQGEEMGLEGSGAPYMKDSRQMGDFTVQPEIDDPPGEAERIQDQAEEAQDAGLPVGDDGMLTPEGAAAYHDALGVQLGAIKERAEKYLVDRVLEGWRSMRNLRIRLGIDQRWTVEDAKFRNDEAPSLDPVTGEIDKSRPYAYLKAGLSMGLFTDACTVLPSLLETAVMGNGPKPYGLKTEGKKQENDLKKRLSEDQIEDQRRKGQWTAEFAAAFRDLPRHGTAIIRQSWCEESEIFQTSYGSWDERVAFKGTKFRRWPLLDVAVSNPERPRADQQDTIIWHDTISLGELSAAEAVFKQSARIDGDDGNPQLVPMEIRSGVYFNVEPIRRFMATALQQDFEETSGTGGGADNQTVANSISVSPHAVLDKFDLQGVFPMGACLRRGIVTSELLAYWGVSLKDGRGNLLRGEAAARLADRLAWYVTVVVPRDGASNGKDGAYGWIVACRACPYRKCRNEMLKGVFIADGSNFYGLSADAIAGDVGAGADKLLNDIADIADNNANPPKAYLDDAWANKAQVRKAMDEPDSTPQLVNGAAIGFRGNVMGTTPNVGSAIQYLLKPFPPELAQLLEYFVKLYTSRTMATEVQKGVQADSTSGTAFEIDAQIQQATARLEFIVRMLADQFVLASIRLILEDIDHFLEDEELQEAAERVSGQLGIRSKTLWTSGQEDDGQRINLADEITVLSAGTVGMRRELMVQFRSGLVAQAANIPNLNVKHLVQRNAMDLGDDPSEYFLDDDKPMLPERELESILLGDQPKVHEADGMGQVGDDHLLHLQAHLMAEAAMTQAIAALKSMGADTAIDEAHLAVLQEHIDEHKQAMLRERAMLMRAQAALGGSGGGAKPGKAGGEPPAGPIEMANGLDSAASGVPAVPGRAA